MAGRSGRAEQVPGAPSSLPGGEGLSTLAQAALALRATGDLGTACAIACSCAVRALEASESRLLRLDARSGALRLLEESGVETPYLAEHGGPVEAVMRSEAPLFDDGGRRETARETLLWTTPPAALATIPLATGSMMYGVLLLSFPVPRPFRATDRMLLQTFADGLAMTLERFELRGMLADEHQRLLELERRKSTDEEASSNLMSVVAHEIRTPLTAIKAYTETLLESLHNPHTPRERFLGIINDECDRLTRLVTDILDLSRLEAGQRPLRLSRFELARTIGEVADAVESLSTPRQIAIKIDVDPAVVVEADADLIKRLYLNLLGNAVKFSPVGGVVRARVEVRGEDWLGIVDEQGPGIPSEDLPWVFERFFRGRRGGRRQADASRARTRWREAAAGSRQRAASSSCTAAASGPSPCRRAAAAAACPSRCATWPRSLPAGSRARSRSEPISGRCSTRPRRWSRPPWTPRSSRSWWRIPSAAICSSSPPAGSRGRTWPSAGSRSARAWRGRWRPGASRCW